MYISSRETLSNEWTPSAVCESCADWLKFEDLSNRDQQDRGSFEVRDHFRSNLGIIFGLGFICGRGSFAALYRTLPNSANIFGPWKTAALITLFHGISFHLAHPTTAQVKDVISVLQRNFSSSIDPTFHHLTNVTNLYLLAATETKRCYATTKHLNI